MVPHRSRDGGTGQATLEFALVLPLVVGVMLFGLQVSLVVRDELMVINAAREAARAASVGPTISRAREAAIRSGALDPGRLEVTLTTTTETVTVAVAYTSRTGVPLVGAMLGDVRLRESTTMRVEAP